MAGLQDRLPDKYFFILIVELGNETMDDLMKKMIEKVKKYEQTDSPYLYNRVVELGW